MWVDAVVMDLEGHGRPRPLERLRGGSRVLERDPLVVAAQGKEHPQAVYAGRRCALMRRTEQRACQNRRAAERTGPANQQFYDYARALREATDHDALRVDTSGARPVERRVARLDRPT